MIKNKENSTEKKLSSSFNPLKINDEDVKYLAGMVVSLMSNQNSVDYQKMIETMICSTSEFEAKNQAKELERGFLESKNGKAPGGEGV